RSPSHGDGNGLQWELEEAVHVDHRACLPDPVHGLHNVSLRRIWRFDAALRGGVQNGARPVQILRVGDRTDIRRPWHDRYWPGPAAAAADPWQTRLMHSYAAARWIGRLAPQLRLHLVHHGREAVQVADVDGEPHTILQARALRLRNQPDIEESLANPGVGILHQCVGRRIDALHAGDKDEVTGPGAETPGALRLDSPGRVECFHAVWRGCLREADA